MASQRPEQPADEVGLAELADHIEQTHHAYLRQEMPRIAGSLARLSGEFGPRLPWLVRLRDAFDLFQQDMIKHLVMEEQQIMPGCRALEQGLPACDHLGCQRSIRGPLKQMIAEHDTCGMMLLRMHELAQGYAPRAEPPPPAVVGVLETLARLEQDTRRHIYKENCLLAFKAEQAEASLLRPGSDARHQP
jgi:regulator of cell morphogenesis and NO signaling